MSHLVHGCDAAVDPLEVNLLSQELRGIVAELQPPGERVAVVVVVGDVRPLVDDADQGELVAPAAGILPTAEDHAVDSGLEPHLHHLLGQKRLRDLHCLAAHAVSLLAYCNTAACARTMLGARWRARDILGAR